MSVLRLLLFILSLPPSLPLSLSLSLSLSIYLSIYLILSFSLAHFDYATLFSISVLSSLLYSHFLILLILFLPVFFFSQHLPLPLFSLFPSSRVYLFMCVTLFPSRPPLSQSHCQKFDNLFLTKQAPRRTCHRRGNGRRRLTKYQGKMRGENIVT